MNRTIEYLNESQVAKMTGIALQTLRNHRFLNKGIRYIKIGRSVRYELQDVIDFMEAHKVETGSGVPTVEVGA